MEEVVPNMVSRKGSVVGQFKRCYTKQLKTAGVARRFILFWMPQNDTKKEGTRKTYKHVITCKVVAKAISNETHACLHHPTHNQQAKIMLSTNKNGYVLRDVSTLDTVDSYFHKYY